MMMSTTLRKITTKNNIDDNEGEDDRRPGDDGRRQGE